MSIRPHVNSFILEAQEAMQWWDVGSGLVKQEARLRRRVALLECQRGLATAGGAGGRGMSRALDDADIVTRWWGASRDRSSSTLSSPSLQRLGTLMIEVHGNRDRLGWRSDPRDLDFEVEAGDGVIPAASGCGKSDAFSSPDGLEEPDWAARCGCGGSDRGTRRARVLRRAFQSGRSSVDGRSRQTARSRCAMDQTGRARDHITYATKATSSARRR